MNPPPAPITVPNAPTPTPIRQSTTAVSNDQPTADGLLGSRGGRPQLPQLLGCRGPGGLERGDVPPGEPGGGLVHRLEVREHERSWVARVAHRLRSEERRVGKECRS